MEDENLEVVSSRCRTAQSISEPQVIKIEKTPEHLDQIDETSDADLTQLILTTNKLNPGDTVVLSATSP